ncbi:MAG: hypothetical protein ACT4O2_04420 [Beijerinckiaceae bacterium]
MAAHREGMSLSAYVAYQQKIAEAEAKAKAEAEARERAAAAEKQKQDKLKLFNETMADAWKECQKNLGDYVTFEQCVVETYGIDSDPSGYLDKPDPRD